MKDLSLPRPLEEGLGCSLWGEAWDAAYGGGGLGCGSSVLRSHSASLFSLEPYDDIIPGAMLEWTVLPSFHLCGDLSFSFFLQCHNCLF